MREPLISVIMPVYNVEKYIQESVDSILKQTYRKFELIIIDDCSTDNTVEIINKYQDQRIVLLLNEKNKGIVYSLNKGIKKAKGSYIARMDGDDICVNRRFEMQIAFMEKHVDVAVCGTNMEFIFDNKIKKNTNELFLTEDTIKLHLLATCNIYHPTVMIRTKDIIKLGMCYEEEFRNVEDYELWTRIILQKSIRNLPEKLLFYRIHSRSISAEHYSAQKELGKKVRRKYLLDIGCCNETVEILVQASMGELQSMAQCSRFQDCYKEFHKLLLQNNKHYSVKELKAMNRILSYIYRLNAFLGFGIMRIYWENRFYKNKFMSKDEIRLLLKILYSCFWVKIRRNQNESRKT